jgi:hypothetical protein
MQNIMFYCSSDCWTIVGEEDFGSFSKVFEFCLSSKKADSLNEIVNDFTKFRGIEFFR